VAALTRDGCSCRRQLIGLAIYATADANIATDMPYKKTFIIIKIAYIFYSNDIERIKNESRFRRDLINLAEFLVSFVYYCDGACYWIKIWYKLSNAE
jgi:hypothetical protein